MTPDDLGPGEISRTLRRLESELTRLGAAFEAGFHGINQKLEETFVRKDLYDAQRAADQATVTEAKRLSWWALALIVGLAVGAVVTFVLTGKAPNA